MGKPALGVHAACLALVWRLRIAYTLRADLRPPRSALDPRMAPGLTAWTISPGMSKNNAPLANCLTRAINAALGVHL